jgi:hypothetical protein
MIRESKRRTANAGFFLVSGRMISDKYPGNSNSKFSRIAARTQISKLCDIALKSCWTHGFAGQ